MGKRIHMTNEEKKAKFKIKPCLQKQVWILSQMKPRVISEAAQHESNEEIVKVQKGEKEL